MTKKDPVSISPTMVEYIHKASKSGMTHSQISEKLISVGHKEHVIKHHFKHVKKKERRKYGWVGVVVVLVVVLIFVFFGKPDPCNDFVAEHEVKACQLTAEYMEHVTDEEFNLTWEVASFEGNGYLCDNLEGYAHDACIDAGLSDVSPEGCSKLYTDYWKEVCFSVYNYKNAWKLDDSEYCKEIILPLELRADCEELFK